MSVRDPERLGAGPSRPAELGPRISRVERGDLLAVPATGAYCLAMSSNYNGALRPAVVVVKDGVARLVQRRQTPQDLQALDMV